jgi:hypothetical protein
MPVAQEVPIQLGARGNFNNSMMQQMSAASQGMFPMMNPALWNIPMGQWPQFFSQMNPLMAQQGQSGIGSVLVSASQSSSIGGQGTGQ